MTKTIAFLHTAQVHVETFDSLLAAMDPSLTARHVVREDLLAEARERGVDEPAFVGRVHEAMQGAAGADAAVVVCTCSTIGAIAERTPTGGRFTASRIDRAMADRAVRSGPRILVAFALESTLEPTRQLLGESADALGSEVMLEPLLVRGAWKHFEQGDKPAYLAAVADAVRPAAARADVAVLAQASMADAAGMLADLPVEVLASPRLGVESALVALRDAT